MKKKEDLEHARELVDEFKGRSMEVRRQKEVNPKKKRKLNPKVEEFKRIDLLERYMAKLLYEWDDRKFKEEYLRKLERNWRR